MQMPDVPSHTSNPVREKTSAPDVGADLRDWSGGCLMPDVGRREINSKSRARAQRNVRQCWYRSCTASECAYASTLSDRSLVKQQSRLTPNVAVPHLARRGNHWSHPRRRTG